MLYTLSSYLGYTTQTLETHILKPSTYQQFKWLMLKDRDHVAQPVESYTITLDRWVDRVNKEGVRFINDKETKPRFIQVRAKKLFDLEADARKYREIESLVSKLEDMSMQGDLYPYIDVSLQDYDFSTWVFQFRFCDNGSSVFKSIESNLSRYALKTIYRAYLERNEIVDSYDFKDSTHEAFIQ